MQRTTVSPSSSTTSRSTPCVAGCCGPMFTSICSALGSGEAAPQREALAQGVSLRVGLPHQDASQIGMAAEGNPEHVEDFTFQPIGTAPQAAHRIHRQLFGGLELDL